VANRAFLRLAINLCIVIGFFPVSDAVVFTPSGLRTAILCLSTLVPACVHAEEIDTEHIFGFLIGTDVGNAGEREFQSRTTGRFSKTEGTYRAINQELELEFVPTDNFRVEVGSCFAAYDINGVTGFDDRRQPDWQGVSLDLHYKWLDRNTAPFGLTLAMETHADRIDDLTAAPARKYATEKNLPGKRCSSGRPRICNCPSVRGLRSPGALRLGGG
jgi:hypothetical protein